MLFSRFLGQEQAGGFDDDFSADFAPLQFSRVLDRGQADLLAIDDQGVAFNRHFTLEVAVHGVVLEHISQIVRIQQIVDSHDFNFGEVLHSGAKHHTADAAEAIDADFDCHLFLLLSKKHR